MKSMDLLHDEPKKLFFKYLLPSISATLVTSIYVLADTIMIGKGISASALAALNLILPVFKLFFKYLLPSISATLVTSIYVLADTIMIGKGISASALAALNLILPVFTLLFGTGLLLGVGGAILMSVANGAGNKKLANTYFTNSVVSGAVIAILYTILGRTFLEKIGYLLGCTERMEQGIKS